MDYVVAKLIYIDGIMYTKMHSIYSSPRAMVSIEAAKLIVFSFISSIKRLLNPLLLQSYP